MFSHLCRPWRGNGTIKGIFCKLCLVALRPWKRPIHHAFDTGRDSVDSPSGCKVKTLMYSTFANELQKLFFLLCYSSLLIDSQWLCVFIMWLFLYFYVWEKRHRGQDGLNFNWKIYEIYNVEKLSIKVQRIRVRRGGAGRVSLYHVSFLHFNLNFVIYCS